MAHCFTGKTAVITGASSGIGQGVAIGFATHGANVVLGGRNTSQLEETKSQCIKAGLKENQVVLVPGDITQDNVQQQMIDAAMTHFHQIDVLVNNAGMVISTPVLNTNIGDFDKVHDVNLRAPISLTLKVLPHLIKSKGNVVNLSSIAAWRPLTGNTAYAMSKAGIDMFTKCLAFEVAPEGVRVNAVNPGVIPTNLGRNTQGYDPSDSQAQARFAALGKLHPLGRCGQVKEVVDAILFLASDHSTFVTGQLLAVDGGAGLGGVRLG
jgi:NAD(P)-dependent dehydrogenase (short-subunit alcohol dehydrogenase family)